MIGTSATNSAATASVHSATQNAVPRRGTVKRLDSAPALGARPSAATAPGAQRMIKFAPRQSRQRASAARKADSNRNRSSASGPQCGVEEADDAPLVLGRAGADPAGVRGLGDLPQLFRAAGGAEVLRVERELLAAGALGGEDEEHGARRDLCRE